MELLHKVEIILLTSRHSLRSILNAGNVIKFGASMLTRLKTAQRNTVTTHWNQVMNRGASSWKKGEGKEYKEIESTSMIINDRLIL